MRSSFKDYFYFSRSERKGVIGMSILIILLILFNFFVADFFPQEEKDKSGIKELLTEISQLKDSLDQLEKKKDFVERDYQTEHRNYFDSIAYFSFNPNNLTIEKWMKLGLSKEQAEVIKNYEAKGGEFRTKEDVRKMYSISEEHYLRLASFIQLPDRFENKKLENNSYKNNTAKKKKWKRVVKDINLADSAGLTEVYGIGSYFAGKIVEHREKLGGYLSKKQLLEIWNFSDSMLLKLDSSLVISKIDYKLLPNKNITDKNFLDFNDLPLSFKKLLELINIKLIKLKFNQQSKIIIKGYELNLNSKFFSKGNLKLKLTEKEIEIILYLKDLKIKHDVADLQKNIWGYSSNMETHTVETHIYRLRKKISDLFKDEKFILTHKNGYFID